MTQFNKEIMAALAQKQDLDEVFRQYLETAINDLMHEELTSFLGYEPMIVKTLTAVIRAMGTICGPLRLSMEN